MRISNVFQAITATFIDWNGFLVNPKHIRRKNEVTWTDRYAGIRNHTIRESDVVDMFVKGQYTCQIADDGSLFQLHYRFDQKSNNLASASLAFYSAVSGLRQSVEDSQSYQSESNSTDGTEMHRPESVFQQNLADPPVSWLRIDFEPFAKERGVIHHDCHLHLSNFPDARFIVSGVPSPNQFIELVIATIYPEKYKEHRLNSEEGSDGGSRIWTYKNRQQINELNKNNMPLEDNPIYGQMTHICVPSGR